MNENKRIKFLGIPVDVLTMEQTVQKVDDAIQNKKNITHVVVNAGKIVAMQKDKELFQSVVSCDIINADGIGVVWGVRFLGEQLPERVTGIDLMINLLKLSSEKKYKCFFLGAKEEVIKETVKKVSGEFGEEIIAGYRNGYFSEEEEEGVAEEIVSKGTQILFVAISSPKKEKFLFRNRTKLERVNFTMGVGGSFDIIAGKTKRAPKWVQWLGMEWFYRFLQEPLRMWKRYLIGNIIYIMLILREKVNQKKK